MGGLWEFFAVIKKPWDYQLNTDPASGFVFWLKWSYLLWERRLRRDL